MNKIARLCILAMICLSSLTVATAVHADSNGVQTVPANFWVESYFSGSGASRSGVCVTGIYTPGSSYRAAVKCEMKSNAGVRIDYDEAYGSFGGYGVGVIVNNLTGNTGRLVLYSTHDMWVNATDYVEYRMVESAG